MCIRKATEEDIARVSAVYEAIINLNASGVYSVGWLKNVYPVRATAEEALQREDLFVIEADGRVVGSAIINQQTHPAYQTAPWTVKCPDTAVMVMHTLSIDPDYAGKGLATRMIAFYEAYARANGCTELRIDTQARNSAARRLYGRCGFHEVETVQCDFCGIPNVQLVLLEKHLH